MVVNPTGRELRIPLGDGILRGVLLGVVALNVVTMAGTMLSRSWTEAHWRLGAEDAVRAFLAGNLDYLLLGPHLVRHPRGIQHPLKAVPGFEAPACPASPGDP